MEYDFSKREVVIMNQEKLNRKIGQYLKAFRNRKGLSQTEVAESLELHQPAYSRIETGQQSLTAPQVWILMKQYGFRLGGVK